MTREPGTATGLAQEIDRAERHMRRCRKIPRASKLSALDAEQRRANAVTDSRRG